MRQQRFEDVYVRVFLNSATEQSDLPIRAYRVAVYTYLPLRSSSSWSQAISPEFRGLSLKTVGTLTLKWARYQDILTQFFDGEKGLEAMQFRVRDWLSPELLGFIDDVLAYPAPISIWWSVEAPELEDIPWEVLFFAKPGVTPLPGFNFIRGLPPESPSPVLPISGPVRLMWSENNSTPQWMRSLLQLQIPGLESIAFSGDMRSVFRAAAAKGIEILHLCSDASMTLAYEGVLRCGDSDLPLSAAELSDILIGSRTSIICLTAAVTSSPTPDSPSEVYRAFASFASSKTRLPSVITPVGPYSETIALTFWQSFYTSFAESHRLDASFSNARLAARPSTFALFSRHSHGRLFRPVQEAGTGPSPSRMATELEGSKEFSERLKSMSAKYGVLPDYLKSFATTESERRTNIESELGKWTATEAEE